MKKIAKIIIDILFWILCVSRFARAIVLLLLLEECSLEQLFFLLLSYGNFQNKKFLLHPMRFQHEALCLLFDNVAPKKQLKFLQCIQFFFFVSFCYILEQFLLLVSVPQKAQCWDLLRKSLYTFVFRLLLQNGLCGLSCLEGEAYLQKKKRSFSKQEF